MSFSFGFAEEGAGDTGVPAVDTQDMQSMQQIHAQQEDISDLQRAQLPDKISYSPLMMRVGNKDIAVPRRDLFDESVGVVAAEENCDLVPGVYEGGLKTWECAQDLVAQLARTSCAYAKQDTVWPLGKHIAEIGCGTAIPSCFLLRTLLDIPKDHVPEGLHTVMDLCDYNHQVLVLVVYPNLLLTWYFSPEGPGANDAHCASTPGDIELDNQVLDAFETSLKQRHIHLRFFSGGWSTLDLRVNGSTKADIVISSETVYSLASLPSLYRIMREISWPTAQDAPHPGLSPNTTLCLVAAKVLYFGVGGGIDAFIRKIEQDHGWAA
ncbi:hypothetical protein MVES_000967 [Malassezia vespertilionis]|uniref:protein-histidine N-methyltransferase n=1 Tax=Malassezia vespertilionis TaxID=2020962 RepID=A0A2N1JFC2_9BASI|nr:hypothetical protein MVES_000967 [Malassezia vespertilionis]